MRMIYKRILSFCMAWVMLFCIAPLLIPPVQTEATTVSSEDDLRAVIEPQIRAFAKSINKTNADDAAAKALAKHGLSGGGKKFSVGKTHALTATIWNSELMQVAMSESCVAAIEYMWMLDMMSLPLVAVEARWNGTDSFFYAKAQTSDDELFENRDKQLVPQTTCSQHRNAYDSSLDWMVATTDIDLKIKSKTVTKDKATYTVTVSVGDRFDFSTGSGSGFKDLISGIGALLFREFDWESTVMFELTVPYSCTHSSGKYHWSYDPESHVLIPDTTDGYTPNKITRHIFTIPNGEKQYYHELENTVRLYHNKPWVLEYTVRNPGVFVFAPLENTDNLQPYLYNYGKNSVFAVKNQRIKFSDSDAKLLGLETLNHRRTHYFGAVIKSQLSLSTKQIYTIRLENVVGSNGTNMIWLTAYNHDLQQEVLKVPMNDYYISESWGEKNVLKSTEYNGISGQDFLINFIGNYNYRLNADYFDLRIWESGVDGGSGNYCTEKVTKPTCTKSGYTTKTCKLCGYSFTDDKTPAKGHTYKSKVTAPTCVAQGFITHTCSCGESYVDSYVDKAAHTYANGICTVCGAEQLMGDLSEDGLITSTDVVLLRRYIAGGYDVTLNPKAADLSGDGLVTATDVVLLRRYIAGGYGITLPQ